MINNTWKIQIIKIYTAPRVQTHENLKTTDHHPPPHINVSYPTTIHLDFAFYNLMQLARPFWHWESYIL